MSGDIECGLRRSSDAMVAADIVGVMRACHPDIRLSRHFGDDPMPF